MKAKTMEEVYGNTRAWMERIYREARVKLEREAAEVADQYALPELKTRVKEDLDKLQVKVRQDLDRMLCVHSEQRPERHHAKEQRQGNGARPSSKRQLSGAEMMPEDGLETGRAANRKQRRANEPATAVNPALAANNVSRKTPRLSQLPAIILTVAHEQTPLDNHRPSPLHQPLHSQPPTHCHQTPHASLRTKTQSLSARDAAEMQPEGGCPRWPLGPGQAWSGPIKENQVRGPGKRFVVPAGEVRYLARHFPSVGEPIHPGFKVMRPGCDECTRRSRICTLGVGTNHRGRERDPTKAKCDRCTVMSKKCRSLGLTGIAPSTKRSFGQTSESSDHGQYSRGA
ncbi:hypothetical protein PANT_12d00068 [Moesziomyces antarcticus T-34]|uniref:Uncharacterized protein n=1 Tax=Pseudozyma antarctica (strain T-34) TaxID=1151754 RepID=M9M340_PSEA3|nr:hypothetical protein PANT_12d00068 [Moesziomyces antarcticus T-34]